MSINMTNENDKIIKNLVSRVEKLERAVLGKGKKKSNDTERGDFKGATGGLRLLIAKGFFNRKQNFGGIKKALVDRDYNYSNQAVQTPLNKLSKAGGPLVGFKEAGKKVYAKRK